MNSLYLPKHFHVKEIQTILSIIEAYPFATVMSFDETGQPFFSHIPVLVQKRGDSISLLGHVAKRNPQWSHFKANPNARVIVHGPHTYITPKWYKSGRDVPTWNYVAIHLSGTVRLIDDFDGLLSLLKELTVKFESDSETPWTFELPEDLESSDALTSAIVGFEVNVTSIEPKFKLSQNRNELDRAGVIEGLQSRPDDMSKEILKLMSANPKPGL